MFGMTQELEQFMEKDLDNLNHYEMLVEFYKSKMQHVKEQYLKDLLRQYYILSQQQLREK